MTRREKLSIAYVLVKMVSKQRFGKNTSMFESTNAYFSPLKIDYRFLEAIKDPKTWIFFFFACFANLVGGVGAQYGLVLKGFGFSTLEAALLNFPTGFAVGLAISSAAVISHPLYDNR